MADTVTLGLEWFLNPDHVPFFVADERGYYADEGIELEVWEPEKHYDTLEELDDGSLDYAITEPIHLVEDRAGGVKVKGIASFLDTPGGIQYSTEKGWDSPADLEEGVRFNYPGAPGEGGRRMVSYMVREAGGSLTAEDIEPVEYGFHHTDAILEDEADIAFLAFYNFEVVESIHRGHETALWELEDYGVPDFSRLTLVASDEKVEENEDEVEGFVRATKRGVEDTVEDPEDATEIFYSHNPEVREQDPELMDKITEATVEQFTPDLSQDTGMYADLVEFCEELELVEEGAPVEKTLSEKFS
jgi:putative hydroxymethylpyrimidine transport system substrate-binding protein